MASGCQGQHLSNFAAKPCEIDTAPALRVPDQGEAGTFPVSPFVAGRDAAGGEIRRMPGPVPTWVPRPWPQCTPTSGKEKATAIFAKASSCLVHASGLAWWL